MDCQKNSLNVSLDQHPKLSLVTLELCSSSVTKTVTQCHLIMGMPHFASAPLTLGFEGHPE